MAIDCAEGVITGLVEDDIIVDGQSCYDNDADVTGKITVTNSEDFTLSSSKVAGSVKVENGRYATVVGNAIDSSLTVKRNERAAVAINVVGRSLKVNFNIAASVKQNGAVVAIVCRGNIRLESFGNNSQGDDECRETRQ